MALKNLNLSGVPLGGIGAGKVEFCPDGAFRNLTWHNNLDNIIANKNGGLDFAEEGIEGSFLAAFVEGFGAVALKENEAKGITTLAKGDIEFEGLFPLANAKYPAMDGVEISLEAFSALSLNDNGVDSYRDNCIPAAVFKLKAVNNSGRKRYVSFAFSWRNIIGMGGYPGAVIKDLRNNTVAFEQDGDGAFLRFSHSKPKVDKRLDGECTIALIEQSGLSSSYFVWESNAFNLSDKRLMWDFFSEDGKLPGRSISKTATSPEILGALCAGKDLGPGEETEVSFVLSWFFPDMVANDYPDIIYKNQYAGWFDNSREAAEYIYSNRDRLYGNIKEWHGRFFDSNLPQWLKVKLINDIFPLYSNSLYTSGGKFSSGEAPSDMGGCMGTIDQRAASSAIYAMCFPELSESELKLFSDQQIAEETPVRMGFHWDTVSGKFGLELDRLGAIMHDVGWDHLEGGRPGYQYWQTLHWPDLAMVYILQVYQQCTWTGDMQFLDFVYPKVKKAMGFLKRLDRNGDGVPELWGPGSNTYDNENFPYYGLSSFINSLYLAVIKACQRLAALKSDTEFSGELEKLCRLVSGTMESKLWDEKAGYYISYLDENADNWQQGERPHEGISKNSMIGQIAGQWFASMHNLGFILDEERIKKAIKSMTQKNVDLVEYCTANEVSEDNTFVSASWPFYTETYYAANAVYNGEIEGGLRSLEKFYKAVYEVDGSPWDVPLDWKGNGNCERGWGRWYMTNPASWYILPALGGFNYNALEFELMLKPNIPASLGKLTNLPIFSPVFHAVMDADSSSTVLTVKSIIKGGAVQVRTLAANPAREILINGKPVEFTGLGSSIRTDILLKCGDVLELKH